LPTRTLDAMLLLIERSMNKDSYEPEERHAFRNRKNNAGFEWQEPGDARLLLLLQLQTGSFGVEAIFRVVPQPDLAQRRLHRLLEPGLFEIFKFAVDARAENEVFINRDRQRIGSLKHPTHGQWRHHANFAAESIDACFLANVFTFHLYGPRNACLGGKIYGAVDAPQQ